MLSLDALLRRRGGLVTDRPRFLVKPKVLLEIGLASSGAGAGFGAAAAYELRQSAIVEMVEVRMVQVSSELTVIAF
jgi:hypothetical protein